MALCFSDEKAGDTSTPSPKQFTEEVARAAVVNVVCFKNSLRFISSERIDSLLSPTNLWVERLSGSVLKANVEPVLSMKVGTSS